MQSINSNADIHKTASPSVPTNAPPPPVQPIAGQQQQQPIIEQDRAGISEAPAVVSQPPLAAGQSILSREEKIEYRDQDGNLLNEEQVKSLEGKVSFKTRYETRTRMVDSQGREINPPPEAEQVGVAPPHPDVEGVDSSTIGKAEPDTGAIPAVQREVQADESKEENIPKSDAGAAKPASEGNEATAS
jgi:dolichyl-phosphate-mannose-protein mannosyltransferase